MLFDDFSINSEDSDEELLRRAEEAQRAIREISFEIDILKSDTPEQFLIAERLRAYEKERDFLIEKIKARQAEKV